MTDLAKGGCNGTIGEFGWSGMLGTWMLIDRKEDLTAVYMQQMFPHMEEYSIPRIRSTVYGAI
jgi:CubicO group peptidase (beta-lactamase class C family)